MAAVFATRLHLLRSGQWLGAQKRLVLPGGFSGGSGSPLLVAAPVAMVAGEPATAVVAGTTIAVGAGLHVGSIWFGSFVYLAATLVAWSERAVAVGRRCPAGNGTRPLAHKQRISNSRKWNSGPPTG
ncbi:hypothetical protein GCM10022409_07070 [Hymenobacter glaciei]|uniref:Uncharacterized protein n=1 Tax=Hymenobacter glaciei TaxID=877209 RepID=A0ABP7TFQ1_9BACT